MDKDKIEIILERFNNIENRISGSFCLETQELIREIPIKDFIDYLVEINQLSSEQRYAMIQVVEMKAIQNHFDNIYGR